MKEFPLSLLPCLLICTLCAGGDGHPPSGDAKPAVLMKGLGNYHHPVATKNPEAQRFFDQGLTLLYAFNHAEAARSFRRAGELDPTLAIAWWGVALALGPNYNLPQVDAEQAKVAYDALQKALQLADGAPEHERAYIKALAARYSADPKADGKQLLEAYAKAMGQLSERYPDDLDAATLAAESAMNLRPWKLWSPAGEPAEGTEAIVRTLESVLRRNPDHPGANHYYIHAIEGSLHPEHALPSAGRLATLVPAAGHLVHMPAHIYIRVGDYEAAARANEQAIEADRAYLKSSGATGVYPLMYFSHNIQFLAVVRATQGRFADAKKATDDLVGHVGPHVKDMPMLEGFLPTATLVLVRFRRWEDVLAMPRPQANLQITTAIWHFARGMAYAAQGKLDDAEKERKAFLTARDALPADAMYGQWNTARGVLEVAEGVLGARLAVARNDRKSAIGILKQAVKAEDALHYGEPPDWFLPVRETLGGVLLQNGDAAEAEKVFRADLDRNRLNGRSLFGLVASLNAQKKEYAARMVQLEFERAWQKADPQPLAVEDL
jgi:tetratricopeptide (TPR) repeat protein